MIDRPTASHIWRIWLIALLALASLPTLLRGTPALAGAIIERISVSSAGTQANLDSITSSVSADGRYVAFYSGASNLVSGDTNGAQDVFARDRTAGQTERISVASDGTQGNGNSYNPSISGDGRYVAFDSDASNLVAGLNNSWRSIFVHDRQTGATTCVSQASGGGPANGSSYRPAISRDGRYVVFYSAASNLVADDGNGVSDIFLHDRNTSQTVRISKGLNGAEANGSSQFPAISGDGAYVAFESVASNLVADDTNARSDVFVYARDSAEISLASVATDGTHGNNSSVDASISDDGRYVAFATFATNLVANDTNGQYDVVVRDRQAGQTTLASVTTTDIQANGSSYWPVLAGDGLSLVYYSYASNLVPGDTNGKADVFRRDLQANTTSLVSATSTGAPGNGDSEWASVDYDGSLIAFQSAASNLVSGDTNGWPDIFAANIALRPRVWLPALVRP